MRKFLKDANIEIRNPKWRFRFLKQKLKYGLDERETYDLDQTFYYWLYERISMYKEVTKADMTYHKVQYKSKDYTQGELLNEILKRIRFYFGKSFDELKQSHRQYVNEIAEMWAVVLPMMWW